MECPRRVERRIGKLESFDTKPGQSMARVRTKEGILNLPTNARGVLKPDGTIALCSNGERYDKIPDGTLIAYDVVLDAKGSNPVTGPWAPKQKPPRQ